MTTELKEVAKLFHDAFRTLTTAKCRVTAMAYFNRAQTMLDELEKHPDPEAAGHVKKLRKNVRDAVGRKDKSLHRTMEIYAAYWGQVIAQL